MQPGLAHVGKSETLLFLSQFPAGPAASWKPIRRLCHQTIQPLPFTSAPHGVIGLIDLKICQDWIFHYFKAVMESFSKQTTCETDWPSQQPYGNGQEKRFFHHWKTTETCNVLQHHGVASKESTTTRPFRLERASSVIVRQIGPRRSCISYIGTRSWKIWEGFVSWKKMHNVVTWCVYAISNKNQQNSSLKSPSHFGYIFFDV